MARRTRREPRDRSPDVGANDSDPRSVQRTAASGSTGSGSPGSGSPGLGEVGTEGRAAPSAREELAALRRALLGNEIDRLEHEIANRGIGREELAQVLPEAFVLGANRDARLGNAMQPTVERAIEVSVKRDPSVLVEAIFPVIGPAIRRAVATALEGMMRSTGEILDNSFSWKGIRWRLEALRTRRPFQEVVLLKNLVYRVEQVFLFHNETGLCVQRIAVDSGLANDPDTVSAMLTAIQDYVKDSFAAGRDATLDDIRVGELQVWIERGPQASLACVLRGTPPIELRETMQESIEGLHLAHGEVLEAYAGDAPEAFREPNRYLKNCLVARERERTPNPMARVLFWTAFWLLLGWAAVTAYRVFERNGRWDELLAQLEAAPGLVVVEVDRGWGSMHVRGLRDPLAEDPGVFARASDVAEDEWTSTWTPFRSLEGEMLAERIHRSLGQPDGVRVRVKGDEVILEGPRANELLPDAARIVNDIPEIRSVGTDKDVGFTKTPNANPGGDEQ